MSFLMVGPDSSGTALPKQREARAKEVAEELRRALPLKTGMAFAITADTVLRSSGEQIPPGLRRIIGERIVSLFPSLPAQEQLHWLQLHWDEVKGPAWIPLLRQIVSRNWDFPVSNIEPAYTLLQVSAAALMDWYGLDPVGARPAVIAEVERPKPRFGAQVLGLLPDRVLRGSEPLVAQHFVDSSDYYAESRLAGLLLRYADCDVLPTVLPKIEQLVGKWACEPQDNALAYVLKVDAKTAKALLERALAAQSQTGCWRFTPMEVGAKQPGPVMEELAVRALYDPSAELAANAAQYLGRYGSASAEGELWKRYVAWSQEWKGRDAELRVSAIDPPARFANFKFGEALVRALASGQEWFAGEQRLREIQSLAPESLRPEIKNDLRMAMERPVRIQFTGIGWGFRVAQYEEKSMEDLEGKLKQFPPSTEFVFSGLAAAKEADVRTALKRWAERRNVRIAGL